MIFIKIETTGTATKMSETTKHSKWMDKLDGDRNGSQLLWLPSRLSKFIFGVRLN